MQNLVRFLKELRAYWRVMFLIVLITLGLSTLSVQPTLLLASLADHLSDKALARRDPVNLPHFFFLMIGIAIGSAILNFCLGYCVNYLGQQFKLGMRRKLYSHMQSLSLGFFEKSQTGKLMSTITNDVSSLDQLVSGSLVTVIQDAVTLTVVIGILFWKSGSLSLVALSVYPFYILNYKMLIGRVKSTHHEMREHRDAMYGDLQEKLSGAMVVRSYAKERFEVRQFVGETRTILGLNVRISAISTMLWTLAEFIGAIGTALLLWWGGRLVVRGELTVGGLVAFYGFIGGYLYGPTLRLIQVNDQFARANAALWRIFRTLDTEPVVKDAPDATVMPPIRGDAHFENVWFEYEPGQPVIKGIELTVRAGQMVAFVGQSGSGKTTMAQLLQRNYDVTGGRITVDGTDIRDVTLKSLREQIGVVIQETTLFNTTIRENLRYGRLNATDAEIEDAARAANIHDTIEALPRGYDTKIGEDGMKLSGGEKQRIAIARALLADPRILIMDEATSSLDSQSESLIQDALDTLLQGRTSFVIAHRLSTIIKADIIVVMSKGEVQEMGSHAELLELDGVYAELYNQQFKVALEGHAAPSFQRIAA